MKEFTCRDCGHKIEVSDGTIILECKPCGAVYAMGENLSLQMSGKNTIEKARLNPDMIVRIITEYQKKLC